MSKFNSAYDDEFSGHIAAHYESNALGSPAERIVWSNPDSGIFRVEYLSIGNCVFVCGDLGDAVFDFSGPRSLRSFAGCNLDYLCQKMRDLNGANSRAGKQWNQAIADAWIKQWRLDLTESPEDHERELKWLEDNDRPESHTESEHEWQNFLSDDHPFAEDEPPYEIGLEINSRFIAIMDGLARAFAQIDSRKAVAK